MTEEYISKCLNEPELKESYYILRSLKHLNTNKNQISKKSSQSFDRIHIKTNDNMQLVLSSQPGRISGGEPCSLYHKEKGWLIQQPIIGKNELPKYCSQVRIYFNNKVYSSYLDHHAILGDSKCVNVLREEDVNLAEFPFGYYQIEISASNIILQREYCLENDSLVIHGELFFDEDIDKIELIIPLLNGEIECGYETKTKEIESPYGQLKVKIMTIPFSKKKGSFHIKIF
ncbi:MAG: hypothetical protein U9R34_06120 [Nanoarchaeota archaeon]|nr:hypothetical protein [Nanoarchaeota archaeon]